VKPQKAFDELAALVTRKVGPAAEQTIDAYRSLLTMGLPDDQVVTMIHQARDQFASMPDYQGLTNMQSSIDHGLEGSVHPAIAALDPDEMPEDSNSAYNEGLELMQSIEGQLRSSTMDGDDFATAYRAEGLFRFALHLAPEHGRAATMLGMLMKFQSRTTEAIDLLKPVVDPKTGLKAGSRDWLIAASTLGESYMLTNNLEQAAEWLGQVAKHQPKEHITLYQLGLCLTALGRADEAVTTLKKAAKLQPDDEDIAAALEEAVRSAKS
jgi:tetratricopeptide (TPR) repeat protein